MNGVFHDAHALRCVAFAVVLVLAEDVWGPAALSLLAYISIIQYRFLRLQTCGVRGFLLSVSLLHSHRSSSRPFPRHIRPPIRATSPPPVVLSPGFHPNEGPTCCEPLTNHKRVQSHPIPGINSLLHPRNQIQRRLISIGIPLKSPRNRRLPQLPHILTIPPQFLPLLIPLHIMIPNQHRLLLLR